jgi:hypothetical protein
MEALKTSLPLGMKLKEIEKIEMQLMTIYNLLGMDAMSRLMLDTCIQRSGRALTYTSNPVMQIRSLFDKDYGQRVHNWGGGYPRPLAEVIEQTWKGSPKDRKDCVILAEDPELEEEKIEQKQVEVKEEKIKKKKNMEKEAKEMLRREEEKEDLVKWLQKERRKENKEKNNALKLMEMPWYAQNQIEKELNPEAAWNLTKKQGPNRFLEAENNNSYYSDKNEKPNKTKNNKEIGRTDLKPETGFLKTKKLIEKKKEEYSIGGMNANSMLKGDFKHLPPLKAGKGIKSPSQAEKEMNNSLSKITKPSKMEYIKPANQDFSQNKFGSELKALEKAIKPIHKLEEEEDSSFNFNRLNQ